MDTENNTTDRQGELLSVNQENPCPSDGHYFSAHKDCELSAVTFARRHVHPGRRTLGRLSSSLPYRAGAAVPRPFTVGRS